MKRRLFLKGAAGATLAAPFLSSLSPVAHAQQAAAPRRLVIFYTQNGCLTDRWFPKVESGALDAAALTGTTLEPLKDLTAKLLVPRGLAMFPRGQYMIDGTAYFDPHDQGMGSKLTAAPVDPLNDHWSLGRSLDHVAAELVNPGKNGPLVVSVGNAFANVKGILSYKAPKEPYAPETKPTNVYKQLTGLFVGGGEVTEADYRVKRGQSVIDLVSGDLATFKRLNMSGADQKRVDDWLALLRETEIQVVTAACNADTATMLGITDADVKAASGGGFGVDPGTAFTLGGDMMMKLIALTMMCDANRSMVLQWPGFVKFNWDGIKHDYDHHGLSHRNGSAAVGGTCVPGVLDSLHQIDTWYAGRYTKLVNLINGIVEGDGTMLDNSAVMWLPELADGNAHNNNNLPIIIAGSAGGYLKQGVAVNLDSKTLGTGNSEAGCTPEGGDVTFGTGSNGGNVPLNKLYVTLLNALGAKDAMGAPIQSFGMVDTNDPTAGITKPGELDALRA
ncbi:MAG TPA: DUF1552 domain-containing protein [Polyangiaceae bacterium]|nr:DUF1552 domain-containing protein [Polyangiaceae bacterium]